MFVGYLYDPSRTNKHYYYHAGWNIQAYVAYVAGIALPFAGFVGTLGASVSPEALRLGDLGWMISFVTSFPGLLRVVPGLADQEPEDNQGAKALLGAGRQRRNYCSRRDDHLRDGLEGLRWRLDRRRTEQGQLLTLIYFFSFLLLQHECMTVRIGGRESTYREQEPVAKR